MVTSAFRITDKTIEIRTKFFKVSTRCRSEGT